MTSNPDPTEPPNPRPRRAWGCLALALALGWVALARVPLVLNARAHLDSDLAVDGLTLIDALNGRWRWHYPATPFIGSPPVLLSWVQARIWGPTPAVLVSGGVVAYGLLVAGAYALNRRAFGPSVAAWGLVPLAFASTGTIWLSGRVTGGHLLAAAWHAWAFALLWDALTKGGWRRSAALGLWCGFGLYIDTMFAVTWVGLGVAALVQAVFPSPGAFVGSAPRTVGPGSADQETVRTADPTGEKNGNRLVRSIACLLAFGLASVAGVAPRVIGQRVDPHDSYSGQLEPDVRVDRIKKNAWILAGDCLPRLIAGHRLPGLQSEPNPGKLAGGPATSRAEGIPWLALSLTVLALYLFARGMVALLKGPDPAIRWGLLASSMAVVGGFLVNRTIDNSDNYRYLVFLLVPWSTGFGLAMARGASRRPFGPWASGALAVAFAALMAVDTARWYTGFGWVDQTARPIRKTVNDPALVWLDDHLEVSTILGDYWDVYRLSFLTGGRVRGVPFPEYPDRFPEIKATLPGGRPRIMIVGPKGFGPRYEARALAQGGREVGRGEGLWIVEWPGGPRP